RVGLTVCPRRSPSQSSGGWVVANLWIRAVVCAIVSPTSLTLTWGNLILCEVSCGETPRDHRVRCLKRLAPPRARLRCLRARRVRHGARRGGLRGALCRRLGHLSESCRCCGWDRDAGQLWRDTHLRRRLVHRR